LYGVYACCLYPDTVAGMVTKVTIDCLTNMNTSVTKVTNVPTVIFAPMVVKVTTGRRCYVYTSALQNFPSLFNTSWFPGIPPIWHRTTFCIRRYLTHVQIRKRRKVKCPSPESIRIGGEEVQLHSVLSSELDGAEWLTFCTGRFTPRKETGYRLNVSFYGLSWSGCSGEFSFPYQDTNSGAFSPWPCLYSDYGFTACNIPTTIETN
jgi:hypothetical protein